MKTQFLSVSLKQFRYYKNLGDQSLKSLSRDQLFFKPESESNSIALIVKHLHGNMLSRWTDFLFSDGEKEWRKRDDEFEEHELNSKEVVIELWEEGWNRLFNALNALKEEDLEKTVYIRNEGCMVSDAIMRQLAHYPYHVGQIVYLAKMQMGTEWKSLSIPKNQSKEYNAVRFSKEKEMKHFSDDTLKENKMDQK